MSHHYLGCPDDDCHEYEKEQRLSDDDKDYEIGGYRFWVRPVTVARMRALQAASLYDCVLEWLEHDVTMVDHSDGSDVRREVDPEQLPWPVAHAMCMRWLAALGEESAAILTS